MLWHEIVMVNGLVNKYGRRAPFLDLGGLERPTICDYQITLDNPDGDQKARYIEIEGRPFDAIDPNYKCVNPHCNGLRMTIEDYARAHPESCGAFACCSVLEHVTDPLAVFGAFRNLLKPDGYGIISTLFSYPHHGDWGTDFWRFTPPALENLANRVYLTVLECGWGLQLHAGLGIRNTQNNEPQEVRTVYCVVARQKFVAKPEPQPIPLPRRVAR